MSRFVRSSKYRHVFGRPTRKEQCYDNLHISKNAWDSNIVKVNPQYISVNWESGGGGAFAVLPLTHRGRIPEQIPLFRGHTATVLDTDWNPFNDSIVASGSDDGKVFIWRVPEGFSLHTEDEESPKDVSPINRLAGHTRKVGHVLFHPSAENVLATSSGDFTVKLWDIESGQASLCQKHNDIVQSLSYSGDGSLLVTTCRDKKLRVWDLRMEKAAHEVQGHSGAKNSRATWMGEHDRIATTGFSKMSDRQLGLWDLRSISEPVGGFQMLDSISGVCMPFWDDGTKCLYLAGKGDGNIRYYEYVNDEFVYLSEYKSADPQRGIAFLPRRGLAVHENEVMRAYKTVNDTYIEPVSFIVPRRAETFQSDIYPEAPSGEPGLSAAEWFEGKNAVPPKFSLETVYSEDSAAQSGVIHSRKTSVSETPTSATPPSRIATSTNVQGDTITEEQRAQVSSPQTISKPSELPSTNNSAKESKPSSINTSKNTLNESSTAAASPADGDAASAKVQTKDRSSFPAKPDTPKSSPTTYHSNEPATSKSTTEDHLARITSLLEEQGNALKAQGERVTQLSETVATLAAKIEEMSSKDEIIRKLEIQLEEARS